MSIDKEIEEKKVEDKYRDKERKKRKRMHVSGKSVFELQRLISKSQGERILKLKKKKK